MTQPNLAVRLSYGLGMAGEGVKNNAFAAFLLFYYQQVVGLDAVRTGMALFLALCADAVSDPLIGLASDRTRHRWGRRHPWMFLAPLPLAGCYLAVWSPPEGLSQTGLFLWLLVFSIGTRLAMTAFAIPHAALGSELATSYDARSALMSLRAGFSWAFGLLHAWMAYTVFLTATPEHAFGLMNPQGYAPFAWFGAAILLASTFLSAVGTLSSAPHREPTPPGDLGAQLRHAWSIPAYRQAVIGGLLFATAFGLSENLANYINTHVWRLTSAQLGLFVLAIGLASIVATFLATPLAARFGKHRVAAASVIAAVVLLQGSIALRALGLVPDATSPGTLPILLVIAALAYTGFILSTAMIGAMIADCTDAMAQRSGDGQAGLLFSASTLVSKTTTGLGTLLAGQVVAFAGIQQGGEASAASVQRLAGASVGLGALLSILAAWAWWTYDLDRQGLARLQGREVVDEG